MPSRCGLRPLLLIGTFLVLPATLRAQNVPLRLHGAWGTNLLTSPGHDMRSSPGRTGHLGIGVTIGGGEGRKMCFQPMLLLSQSAFRTRMAYRVHFVTERSQAELDLLLGFPQVSGTMLQAGVFMASVTRVHNRIELDSENNFFPIYRDPSIQRGHHHEPLQAGLVLGLAIPLGTKQRWGLDIQFRQHLIPLVSEEQYFALVHKPEQLVMATNTRPSILTIGISFRVGGG